MLGLPRRAGAHNAPMISVRRDPFDVMTWRHPPLEYGWRGSNSLRTWETQNLDRHSEI